MFISIHVDHLDLYQRQESCQYRVGTPAFLNSFSESSPYKV